METFNDFTKILPSVAYNTKIYLTDTMINLLNCANYAATGKFHMPYYAAGYFDHASISSNSVFFVSIIIEICENYCILAHNDGVGYLRTSSGLASVTGFVKEKIWT